MRLIPQGMAGRFALLLGAALIAANLIAAALVVFERVRLDGLARMEREVERIVSLVPAIEAAQPRQRPRIARDASSRNSRVTIRPQPIILDVPRAPLSRALARELREEFPDRDLQAAVIVPRPKSDSASRNFRGWRAQPTIAVSIRLTIPEGNPHPPQWLNVVARGNQAGPPNNQGWAVLRWVVLSLVTVMAVGLLFLRRLTRPLAQIAAAADAAGRGDRSARVPEQGARELREAARAFNDMQSRIEQFDGERMRTLAAVGHDLRTPITSLRIRAEMLDPEEGAPMIRTLDEMVVMADGLVAYARGAGAGEDIEPVALGPLLEHLCEDRGASFVPGPDLSVPARPVALGRAIGNLIDNALRYGETATVTHSQDGAFVVISITDTGPGIPADQLDAMFEPFQRGDASRSSETGGTGLGLSIARNIITAHGGTLTLSNQVPNGLIARIRLPLADAKT